MYISLLRVLLLRELYNKYSSLLDRKELKESHRELSFMFNALDKLVLLVPNDISCDELQTYFWTLYPTASHDIYDGLFKDLHAVNVSAEVGETILAEIEAQKLAVSLSEASYRLSQGQGSLEEVQGLLERLKKPVAVGVEEYTAVTTDLEIIVSDFVDTPGLRWRLDCLNKSMGSLRKGNFGFIFARPETGKTTFLASEASAMIDQTDKPILWFNNEQVGEEVMFRFYQAYFGVEQDVLKANTGKYKKLFQERVGGKFILVDNASIDCRTIERIVHRVQPSLIIYDQIDKIKGFKADRDDLVYGAIYQWARELAKAYAPTIGVCQADGSGEGQKWLTMGNVANAKTSKQAEADWILGIGRTNDEAGEFIRYLALSKNKLMGDKDTLPSLRHAHFETLIMPEVARFKDIVNYS